MPKQMTNIEKVRHYQFHIDKIIFETRVLIDRLNTILVPPTTTNLINKPPMLRTTATIEQNRVTPITDPILSNVASPEDARRKSEELHAFKEDVIELFTRLQTILQWSFIMELCGLGGTEPILIPRQQLHLIDIYCEYQEHLGPSSSSSEDSCNLGATFD